MNPGDHLTIGASDRPGQARVLLAVAVATTSGVLPAFLVGSQAVQLQRALDFSPAVLGAVVATSWGSAALVSAPMGRLSERIGGGVALRLAAALSTLACLTVALLATSWPVLAAGVALGGLANALAQPAANLLIARVMNSDRHGLAFAVKQSAIPFGSLLGGLAVPSIALTLGWRWTFAAGAVLALVAALAVPVGAEESARSLLSDASLPDSSVAPVSVGSTRRVRGARLRPLLALGVGVGAGAAAAGGLSAFLTNGAVAAGMEEGAAGLLLSAGSICCIVVRVAMGHRADVTGRDQFPTVALMMIVGAVGFAAMAAQWQVSYLVATPVAFGAGWAWPGLFNLSVVRGYPDAPAAATGVTQTGTYLGAGGGPLLFGLVVDRTSYTLAWLVAASLLLVGAAAVVVGRELLHRRGLLLQT